MLNRTNVIVLLILFIACQSNTESKKNEPNVASEEQSAEELLLDSAANELVVPIVEELLLDYDTLKWTELVRLDETFVLDLKYATEDNFVKEQMYTCPRCFLRPSAAVALQKVQEVFKAMGYRIKLLDCYRPSPVQQRLWDKVPNASYVTPPSKGSMHNRGLAVDLTLVEESGEELDMGTPYDFFGRKAHHTHTDLPKEVLANRHLLKSTMEAFGFKSIRTEWWHYSYPSGKFPLDDMEWECE